MLARCDRPTWTFLALALICSPAFADHHELKIVADDGKFRVLAGDDLFCEVDYSRYAKPIVYPIYGPDQVPMTRNFPMEDKVEGEATDHPHHKSMWFGHGLVNEISFWHEQGKTVTEKAEIISAADSGSHGPTIRLSNRLEFEDKVLARETIIYSFGHSASARWIDWDVTLHATEGDLKLGDTKEGTAALRVHPNLRLENDEKRGVTTANGQAINSEGVTGRDIWGKRAAWVDYYGTINDKSVGIAFLDHPKNFRHPTYWHARTYGLFAANPFGLSHFVGKDNNGTHNLAQGETMQFRYRIVFHAGTAEEAKPDALFKAYAEGN